MAAKKVVTKKAAKKPVDPLKQAQRELKRLRVEAEKAEFRWEIARDLEKEVNEQVAQLKKVLVTDADVIGTIISAVSALIAKHYPNAYSAHLDIHLDPDAVKYIPGFRLSIPTPAGLVPTADELKRAVKRYATANHPKWDEAHVTISKGMVDFDESERYEVLLIEPAKGA